MRRVAWCPGVGLQSLLARLVQAHQLFHNFHLVIFHGFLRFILREKKTSVGQRVKIVAWSRSWGWWTKTATTCVVSENRTGKDPWCLLEISKYYSGERILYFYLVRVVDVPFWCDKWLIKMYTRLCTLLNKLKKKDAQGTSLMLSTCNFARIWTTKCH